MYFNKNDHPNLTILIFDFFMAPSLKQIKQVVTDRKFSNLWNIVMIQSGGFPKLECKKYFSFFDSMDRYVQR